ncbi:TPA: hypothetical protein L7276_003823 [Escherichia coli]|nr:hypothetical protein [Escherichia coli]
MKDLVSHPANSLQYSRLFASWGGYEFYYSLNDFHILKASMLSTHNYKKIRQQY